MNSCVSTDRSLKSWATPVWFQLCSSVGILTSCFQEEGKELSEERMTPEQRAASSKVDLFPRSAYHTALEEKSFAGVKSLILDCTRCTFLQTLDAFRVEQTFMLLHYLAALKSIIKYVICSITVR